MSRPLDSTGLKRLHRSWRRRTTGRVALVLVDVQSPFNVGSILRTAAALRVDHLWLVGDTAPPTGAKTAKTALGTERYLRWSHHDTVAEAAEAAAGGYRVSAWSSPGATRSPSCPAGRGVPGRRARGPRASRRAHRLRRRRVHPQLGRVGSLNVAVATAVALYEVRRRSGPPGTRPGGPELGG